MKPSFLQIFPLLMIVGVSKASALIWDANGAESPNPSDGSGGWFDDLLWWDGAGHVTWDNAVHGSSIATFGAGGTSGVVNLNGGNANVAGLEFRALGSTTGYGIGGGTITIAANGLIDIYAGSSSPGGSDRIRFTSTSKLAGSNVKITNENAAAGTESFVSLSGENSWTGKLTLAAGSGNNLFVNATNTKAFTTLSEIEVRSGVTLALEASGAIISAPTLRLAGSGAAGRGAIRIDQVTRINSNIVLTADTQISTNAGTGSVGTIAGQISGGFQLTVGNSNGDMNGRYILANANNSYGNTVVSKGNLQIGIGGVGRTGTGLVTLNGSNAVISGTGSTQGGLLVNNGTLRPGDNGGSDMGVLTIAGNLNLGGVSSPRTVAEFTLGGPSATSDRLNVTGNLTLNSNNNLVVAFAESYTTPTLGDSWTLISYNGTLNQGTFDPESNLILPDISSSGYEWLVGAPVSNGSLSITIVPEPAGLALSGLGSAMLVARRRRK